MRKEILMATLKICRWARVAVCLAFFTVYLAAAGALLPKEEYANEFWIVEPLSESILRLHVVADSNDPGAQEFKMKVVGQVRLLIAEHRSRGESWEILSFLQQNLGQLELQLRQYAGQVANASPPIAVSLVQEDFPLRTYGRRVYPPGQYQALKVVIGEGRGDNWWCLLFPSLCLPLAETNAEQRHPAAPPKTSEPEELGRKPIKSAAPAVETGGWKFLLTERWNRWFRNN